MVCAVESPGVIYLTANTTVKSFAEAEVPAETCGRSRRKNYKYRAGTTTFAVIISM